MLGCNNMATGWDNNIKAQGRFYFNYNIGYCLPVIDREVENGSKWGGKGHHLCDLKMIH